MMASTFLPKECSLSPSTGREISCRVTRTLLTYVRDENNGSLGSLLDGLTVSEAYLADTHNWISHACVQELFRRMILLLGDEEAVCKMPLAVARRPSRGLVHRLFQLLGSPKLVYAQAPRFNRLTKTVGHIRVHEVSDSHALIEDRFHGDLRKTRYDCDYLRGLLATTPTMFGLPSAQVEELECELSAEERLLRPWGDDPVTSAGRCLYLVRWNPNGRPPLWSRLLSRHQAYHQVQEDLLRSHRSLQQKYAEAQKLAADLDASERRYRLLAENVSDILWTLRLDSMKFSYVSPSATHVLGYPQDGDAPHSLEQLLAPDSLQRAYQVLASELGLEGRPGLDPDRSTTLEVRLRCADSTYKWAESRSRFLRDATGRPVKVLGVLRDISERKRVEEESRVLSSQLERARRMEAVGNLAAGVAHDLNNMLSSIVGYPELLLLDLPADSPLRPPLEIMRQSGRKAAAIVQDLLTIARLETGAREVLDLNTVVAEYQTSPEQQKILEFHPGVALEVLLGTAPFPMKGSAVHLSKLLMNLAANAAEAMPAGGRMRLATGRLRLEYPLNGHETVPAGEYVHLRFEDEGVGIPEGDLKRIFEPFFTKKQMGRSGTGLGMTVIWATVKDHHGFIDVTSREGLGTRFDLYFPAVRDSVAQKPQQVPLKDYLGQGHILVVDDMEDQRTITASMLRKLGYQVETAASGEAAMACLETRPADLVVLDMFLEPNADGLDAYRQMVTSRPGQKAILISGSTTLERVKAAQALGAGAFVPKPFTLEAIGLAVRRELERT